MTHNLHAKCKLTQVGKTLLRNSEYMCADLFLNYHLKSFSLTTKVHSDKKRLHVLSLLYQ